MKRLLVGIISITVLLGLFACSAPDTITRSAVDRFKLGETTQDEIRSEYGNQDLIAEQSTPGGGLVKLSYAYRDPNDEASCDPSVYAIKQVDFFFKEDKLYGVQYISSMAGDCTKFDDAKVTEIKVGETGMDQVKEWLGPPNGKFLADGPGIIWRYVYVQKNMHSREYDRQSLDILFDEEGIVQDFKLDSFMGS